LPYRETVNSLSASHISNTEAPYTRLFSNGLAIACLNINSLLAHIDDLTIFMDNSKIDILSINEPKLDSSISNSEIHLSGYDVVRLDRKVNGRSGGGVCMYIRSNLNFRIREDLANNDLEILII
jgi:exonuclease III